MRSFLITIMVLALCGCSVSRPYMDLRHHIYLVPDQSFWSGCDDAPSGSKACRKERAARVRRGIDQWFDYFDEAHRPRAIILHSYKEAPPDRVNNVIYLRIKRGICKGKRVAACYKWKSPLSPAASEIVLVKSSYLTSHLMAHEFGHALGREDNDVPRRVGSIMSYKRPTSVLLQDAKMMCRLHRECKIEKGKGRLELIQ